MAAYDLADEEEAKEYLKNVGTEYRFGCFHEKKPEVCHMLADFLENVHKDFEKAGRLYRTNCDEYKYGHSCFKYGNYHLIGRGGVEKDVPTALRYYESGCAAGHIPACHNTGLVYSSEKLSDSPDFSRAAQYFRSACSEDHAQSCYHLSGLYISGKLDKDWNKAFEYANRACDLGSMYACANVSQMYRKGEGVVKDETKAKEFRVKAREMEREAKNTKPMVFGQ